MPTYLFGMLMYATPNRLNVDTYSVKAQASILLLLFIGTFMVPSLVIYYLYRTGRLQDMAMPERTDRKWPLFLTGLIYTGVTYLFAFRMNLLSDTSPQLAVVLAAITLSILLVAFISLYWKISAHTVGVGGVLGVVLALMTKYGDTDLFLPLVGLLAISGLVATARLQLNAHTLEQVLAGWGLGVFVSSLTVFGLL
ncbi:hypothetical protein J2I47_03425 [Fibrella sp. HMF5335]|uniref:PAP2 superfamily protein n=2 Tax=Fibrella rubiginis TaxID=2817060 RepID=A0A939K3X7_9BACT|nr:hypothetical protein [Fibrella rubiginis]